MEQEEDEGREEVDGRLSEMKLVSMASQVVTRHSL